MLPFFFFLPLQLVACWTNGGNAAALHRRLRAFNCINTERVGTQTPASLRSRHSRLASETYAASRDASQERTSHLSCIASTSPSPLCALSLRPSPSHRGSVGRREGTRKRHLVGTRRPFLGSATWSVLGRSQLDPLGLRQLHPQTCSQFIMSPLCEAQGLTEVIYIHIYSLTD